nr:STAS domain-containing protein [Kineosporia mesophila]
MARAEQQIRTPRYGHRISRGGDVELTVATRREGVQTVISVAGEIDVYTAPTLRERLNELVTDGEYHLVVDMGGVDFLDSTGLGVLVGGLKRARSHDGSLRLVCDQEKILKVFRITGLTKVFPIHASLEEALAEPAGDPGPVTISLDSTTEKSLDGPPDGESSRGTP